MSDEIKRIDIKEFREVGFLQEVNRQFFHPLGLALEVKIHEDGTETIGGVWDYRDDPEGVIFGQSPDPKKTASVRKLFDDKSGIRLQNFGYIIQPVEEK
jgi:hypothetical protein